MAATPVAEVSGKDPKIVDAERNESAEEAAADDDDDDMPVTLTNHWVIYNKHRNERREEKRAEQK